MKVSSLYEICSLISVSGLHGLPKNKKATHFGAAIIFSDLSSPDICYPDLITVIYNLISEPELMPLLPPRHQRSHDLQVLFRNAHKPRSLYASQFRFATEVGFY